MGDFRVVIEAVGGHGCNRDVKDGQENYGCGYMGCPDCMTREFVAALKRTGAMVGKAELTHWPADILNGDGTTRYTKEGEVRDNLLTRVRTGSFQR